MIGMEKINVTLTAPKQLYQIVKRKISPSKLFEVAMRAVVGTDDTELSEYDIQEKVIMEQIMVAKQTIADLDVQIRMMKEEQEQLKVELEKLEQRLKDIRLEAKYFRLQRLLTQLRMIARTYDWQEDLIVTDETAQGVIEQILEIKPDFDLRKWLSMVSPT